MTLEISHHRVPQYKGLPVAIPSSITLTTTMSSTSATTMNAVAYTSFGGPEVTQIVQLPIPVPAAGEVQVRVTAGGLNPIDWHQRKGELNMVYPFALPLIAGNEFSGVVSKLGNGVTQFAVGDKVICRVLKGKLGGLGEYAVMPADIIARAPTSIPLADAAGLPLAALTAEQALDSLDVKAGDRLLVTGGAGGVGQYAIQLAKIRGATVATTASSAGKPYVLKAGADEVIDYHTQKLADLPEKFDKVFDAAGGAEALATDVIPSVKRGGQITSVAGPLTWGIFDGMIPWWKSAVINLVLSYQSWGVTSAAATHGVEYKYMFMRPDGPMLQKLADYVDAGKLVINIDSRFKMDDYAKAFERLESGRSKGKIIIQLDGK